MLDTLGAPFSWDIQQGGLAGIETHGDPLPGATLDSIRRTGLALKGPLTTPVGGGFRSINVRLREEFHLYANLRPAHTLVPGGRFEDIDLVLIRENLEGLYVAFEHYIPVGDDPHAVAISSGVNTREGSRRIARFAFDHALKLGRKKVTIVHKANVLKALTGVFLEAAREVAREYEGRIAFDDRIVDACAMQLVLNPWQFDVIVTTNLFGDILSDLIAGLVGGLGPRRVPTSARSARSSRQCMARRRTSPVRPSQRWGARRGEPRRRRVPAQLEIELVLTRHEQSAAFMAATHGRLTGRPGVCISTLGPGALNLVTGAAYAHLGAMPMVLITGQKGIMSSRRRGSRSSTWSRR